MQLKCLPVRSVRGLFLLNCIINSVNCTLQIEIDDCKINTCTDLITFGKYIVNKASNIHPTK